MIREHLHELWHGIDTRPTKVRLGIAVFTIASLPVLGTLSRTVGEAFSLGGLTVPLLVVAHVPALIAALALWSVASDTLVLNGWTRR
ncbi:MAG: hypothetical protein ACI9QA_000024 [Methanobacteriota archaeon]|jgi:hypothetical protein